MDVTWFPVPYPVVSSSWRQSDRARAVHFVGSIPLASPDQTFRSLCGAFPKQLKRIADGETAERRNRCRWQATIFEEAGLSQMLKSDSRADRAAFSNEEISRTMASFPSLDTKYDQAALSSYRVFAQHKASGLIPRHVKFQVSILLPSTFVSQCIEAVFQEHIFPLYEAAVARALQRIQAQIPHQDLAIQIDCHITSATSPSAWIQAAAQISNTIAKDVELGFHICNNEASEPPDASTIVDCAFALRSQLRRSVAWFHFPVAIAKGDEAYMRTLQRLLSDDTEVYLGLADINDTQGSRRTLRAATRVLQGHSFGIATPSGLGDYSQREFQLALELLEALSAECG